MLILHLSDIHFKHPDCNDPSRDPDQPVRSALIADLRERVADIGPVHAILFTGDIAFRGLTEEYEAAGKWIEAVATTVGCPAEGIYLVPGNHDVDRNCIAKNQAIKNAHAQMLSADDSTIERVVREQLSDKETERALLKPLDAYNAVAVKYDCAVLPEKWSWIDDVPDEASGVVFRLYGIASTLLSGAVQPGGNQNDRRETLYLSPRQIAISRQENVVNLVLSHHPPHWFRNYREVGRAMENYAHIQFFGHEHERRHEKTEHYIRLFASAVNPDRSEAGTPGYNLETLTK